MGGAAKPALPAPDSARTGRLLAALAPCLLLAGACLIRPYGDLRQPSNVAPFLCGAAILCLAFLLALRARSINPIAFWLAVAGARAVLFGMEPGADVFRYLWEGRIQNAGFSPYCLAPDAPVLAPLRDRVWAMVEHKDVSAIYPPLAELVFRAVAFLSGSVAAMKAVFIAADLASCWLLWRRFGARQALVYAWNPLVLYSFAGGSHYDSLFILTMVWAAAVWEDGPSRARRVRSAALLGAGVALKWLCLPVLGWVLWRILRLDGLKRCATGSLAALAPFLLSWVMVSGGQWSCPLIPREFTRVARSAEALPALGDWLLPAGHILNKNSTYLAIFAVVSLLLHRERSSLQRVAHSMLSAAFLLTPMFHAWYGTWIAPLFLPARSAASIALSLSAFIYFRLHYVAAQPGGIWRQSRGERLLLWVPFIAGLVWDYWPRRGNRFPPGASNEGR